MSVSIGVFTATVLATMIIVSPAHGFVSDYEFEWLRRMEMEHCGVGRPPHQGGDVPTKAWQRIMKLCKEYSSEVDQIRKRCALRLPENNYACSQFVRNHYVLRYPPLDPRKR